MHSEKYRFLYGGGLRPTEHNDRIVCVLYTILIRLIHVSGKYPPLRALFVTVACLQFLCLCFVLSFVSKAVRGSRRVRSKSNFSGFTLTTLQKGPACNRALADHPTFRPFRPRRNVDPDTA